MTDNKNRAQNFCRPLITNVSADFTAVKLTASFFRTSIIRGFVGFNAGDSRLIKIVQGGFTIFDDFNGVPLKHFEYKISEPQTEEEFKKFQLPYLEEYRKLFNFKTINIGQILSLEVVGKIGSLLVYGEELIPW